MIATLAPDVVLRSPITDRVVFRGHQEMRELLASVFVVINAIHYFADVGDQRTRALFHARTSAVSLSRRPPGWTSTTTG